MFVLNPKVVLWNIIFYLLSVQVIFLAIQHSAFFYSWPPNFNYMVYVPWFVYFILGVPVYLLFKLSHFVEQRGEMVKSYK